VIETGQTRPQGNIEPNLASGMLRDPLAFLLGFAGLSLVVAWLLWFLQPTTHDTFRDWTGLAGLPAGVLAALASLRLRRARKLDPGTRRMWALAALALVVYGIGALLNLVALHWTAGPYLGPVAFGLEIATYAIAWIALSALPGSARSKTDFTLISLDFAIIAWSTMMVAWHLWLYPAARQVGADVITAAGVAIFPALDIVIVGTVGSAALRAPHRGTAVALWLVCGAMAVTLVGDVAAGPDMLRASYRPGGVVGLLYSAAWFGIGAAIYAQWRIPQRRRTPRHPLERWRALALLPYVAVALAVTVPVVSAWDDQETLRQHVPAAGLLMALVIARLGVTARENARLAAAERERLATVVEQTTDGVVITNQRGIVTYVNPAFTVITGFAEEDVVGRPMSALEGGDPGIWSAEEVRAVLARGETWAGRMEGRRRDGEPFAVLMTVAPLRDRRGTISGSVGVARDILRERELEMELAQAQRMEAIGRLAGGVAHDFNNILTVINGFSELALTELDGDHPVREDIAEISRASDRAASLTRALLAFSRRQVMRPQPVHLNEVVAGMAPMLEVLMGEAVQISVKPADNLGWAMADRAQLEQVILNLASNARDAMPEGGRLTITTRNVNLTEKYARGHFGASPGPHVALSIADTGVGMTPEVKEHAFEPFFTTKERGKGTGLGLSTVIGVVQQSGGSIELQTKPGSGTELTVYLPRAARPAPPQPKKVAAPEPRPSGGSETILVVEDEGPVRAFVERTLRQAGYRVLTAANGAEALSVARKERGIQLLFTDMVMPGMTGRELAAKLAEMRPGLPAVFASGYSEEALKEGFGDQAGIPYLAKPFAAEALLGRVREALDAGPRGSGPARRNG